MGWRPHLLPLPHLINEDFVCIIVGTKPVPYPSLSWVIPADIYFNCFFCYLFYSSNISFGTKILWFQKKKKRKLSKLFLLILLQQPNHLGYLYFVDVYYVHAILAYLLMSFSVTCHVFFLSLNM